MGHRIDRAAVGEGRPRLRCGIVVGGRLRRRVLPAREVAAGVGEATRSARAVAAAERSDVPQAAAAVAPREDLRQEQCPRHRAGHQFDRRLPRRCGIGGDRFAHGDRLEIDRDRLGTGGDEVLRVEVVALQRVHDRERRAGAAMKGAKLRKIAARATRHELHPSVRAAVEDLRGAEPELRLDRRVEHLDDPAPARVDRHRTRLVDRHAVLEAAHHDGATTIVAVGDATPAANEGAERASAVERLLDRRAIRLEPLGEFAKRTDPEPDAHRK